MKLAILIPTLYQGGAEHVAALLANEWSKAHEVTVVVLQPGIEQAVNSAVRVESLNVCCNGVCFYSGWSVFHGLARFRRFMESDWKPDAVLGMLETSNLILSLYRRLNPRTPVALVGGSRTYVKRYPRLYRVLFRCYRQLDALVVNSRANRMLFVQEYGLEPGRVIFAPNPVDADGVRRTAHGETPPLIARLVNRGRVLVAVGRLVKPKNFAGLIDAFAIMRQSVPDAFLIILGEGPERGRLERRIAGHGLSDAVFLPGHADNPFVWMNAANGLVLSSVYEGWPNVLIEAMTLGRPVVATDCPTGPREILEDGKWGRLVAPGNSRELAEAMVDLLKQPRRDYPCVDNWQIKAVAQRYLNIMQSIIEARHL